MEAAIWHRHVPAASIGDALDLALELAGPNSLVVVSCIDSGHGAQAVRRALSFHGVPHELVHGNVVLTRAGVERARAQAAFTGFDEVWVFAGSTPHEDLSELSKPSDLLDAARRWRCLLVAGDGCGLNYITTDARIARALASLGGGPSEELLIRLVAAVPGLRPAYEEHVADNDVLLPHVFLADVARYVTRGFESSLGAEAADRGGALEILAMLEAAFATGDEGVQELVAISFLENIEWSGASGRRIHAALGAQLRAELRLHMGLGFPAE